MGKFSKVKRPYPVINTIADVWFKVNRNGTYLCYICNNIFGADQHTFVIIDFCVCEGCFEKFRKDFEELHD